MPRLQTFFLFSILLVPLFLASATPAASSTGVEAALAWLRGQQQADGGFSNGFSPGSDIGATADAVVAIASAGQSPSGWLTGGTSPLEFLAQHAAEATSPGLAAKVTLAAIATGEEPREFGGIDLTVAVAQAFDPAAESSLYDRALALLALEAAEAPIPAEAVSGMTAARLPDGSFAFDASLVPGNGDSNTTGLVVQALLVSGHGAETLPSFAYFRATQNGDGGWTYQKPSPFGEATDANSTALVVQALLAGGQDLGEWGDPLRALIALQQPSGALAFNAVTPGDNLLATIQAIPPLAGVDLTDVPRLAGQSGAPNTGVILGAAALLLALVLLAAGVVGRLER
jgi:hypothetical protein